MTPLERMKLLTPSLNEAYERMNARIEELEREIVETGLNVSEAYMPLQAEPGSFLTWAKRSGTWRLCVVSHLEEIELLQTAPRDVRLEAIRRIDEFHQCILTQAEKVREEMEAT